ncbi:MAG: DUF4197 domain-containing protein [Epsilonproteobacteria bacterium]|nr:DUF4197 domain-containing protein [Campylobacterota bacterium]
MKIVYTLLLASIFAYADLSSLLNSVGGAIQKSGIANSVSSTSAVSSLASTDKIKALKEALSEGTTYAIKSLSKNNGFLDNPKVKIPLPSSIDKAASIIRKYGGKEYVDNFEAAINHAAEKAMPKAYDIFANSIKNMSIKDAEKLLTGGKHSATDFFKDKNSQVLYKEFYPIIKNSIRDVDVMKYYGAFKDYYQKFAPSSKSSSNSLLGAAMNIAKSTVSSKYNIDLSEKGLDDYVTKKAIDGLFYMMAQEEEKIRANPLQATSSLVKKVFSAYK